MAGMFYSLKETAEKLGLTEDDVKQLAEDGKLREFRDGSNLLFKIEEVNALLEEAPEMDMDLGLEPDEAATSTQELLGLEPVADEAAEQEPSFGLEAEAAAPPETPDLELSPDAEATSDLDLSADLTEEEPAEEASEDDNFMIGMPDEEEPLAKLRDDESEIALAPESGILDSESDITDMDTALAGEGIDVLGKSDADYEVTDDSLAETVGPAGTSTEASLEEIEDDVNLDSFGSGSGLLDLSLQADDTSLGGILDEIYTSEGGEEGTPAAEGDTAGEEDMVGDMATEAEHVGAEEEMGAPETMMAAPVTIAQAFAEVPPDTQSNMLGTLLFLPLLALLYAAIVVVAAQRGIMPSILESIQGFVWYVVGGAAFVAILVTGASFVMGAERKPKAAKAKKEKAPKGKKAKPEKAPKAEPPKKEKKPLFGKKK